jgi:hypothetical protein
MHSSDDTPLSMFLMSLAFARGGFGAEADQLFVRGRVAIMIWLPGLALITLLATWIQSLVVGLVGISLLLAGLWLCTERAPQVAAWVRKGDSKAS